ncbi:hypothetical protein [Streptomyces solincola]|nr:hypothetical protein [Streptomyces solincola]
MRVEVDGGAGERLMEQPQQHIDAPGLLTTLVEALPAQATPS